MEEAEIRFHIVGAGQCPAHFFDNDHTIRNRHGYEEIWKYIEDNPRKWEGDCFYMAEQ